MKRAVPVSMLCLAAFAAGACEKSSAVQAVSPAAPGPIAAIVSVQGPAEIVGVRQTVQLRAVARLSDGTTVDRTATAVWKTSNPAVVSVSEAGLATTIGFGLADVSAETDGSRGMLTVTVSDPIPGGSGTPSIAFTAVPPKGTWPATVKGQVLHVLPADHRVAVYIHTWNGWWSKPYWASPTEAIDAKGAWSCLITTGGIDETADIIVAFLIPATYAPPLASGHASIPSGVENAALAKATAKR